MSASFFTFSFESRVSKLSLCLSSSFSVSRPFVFSRSSLFSMWSFWFCRKKNRPVNVCTWNLQPLFFFPLREVMHEVEHTTNKGGLGAEGHINHNVCVKLQLIHGLCWLDDARLHHVWPTNDRRNKNYLQLQLQNLLFQLSHFGLFPVSCCLCCDSVLEFPEERERERKRNWDIFSTTVLTKPPDMHDFGFMLLRNHRPCSCHAGTSGPADSQILGLTSGTKVHSPTDMHLYTHIHT